MRRTSDSGHKLSKYCDHTPLYRQAGIFARHGIDLKRSTLANWVGGACWWFEPLYDRLRHHLLTSSHLFADDTPVPVLNPGRGRTRTGRLWVYVRDQRPWAGTDPPVALYCYEPDRKAERPATHLESFKGVLHVDGYAGFEALTSRGDIVLAACWAHTRRKFYDVHQATGSPIAAEALGRIARLYDVERQLRGQPPVALGRKNHLFAGSDSGGNRWAMVCSLIETAKLNGIEPWAYINDILERMTNGHPASQIDDLLPWNWTPQNTVN